MVTTIVELRGTYRLVVTYSGGGAEEEALVFIGEQFPSVFRVEGHASSDGWKSALYAHQRAVR